MKKWCFWTVVLGKTLESPLDCKEIQPVHSKGDQSWIFIGRTDAEAETIMLWPPDVNNWLMWKHPDAGKDWEGEEKGRYRGWDGWMASPTQWTWVSVDSGSWTGRPGVLQPMVLQRVGQGWETQLKDLPYQIAWSNVPDSTWSSVPTPPWTPSGHVEGQQLQQCRVQSPQRQMANAFFVQSSATILASANCSYTYIYIYVYIYV